MVTARTLPVTTFGGGISAVGVLSLPGVEAALIHVDKGPVTGAEDGTRQNPYHTVAQGLAAAAAIAAAGNPAVCLVYPGEYAETGLVMAADYVSLVGVGGRDAVRIAGTTQPTVLTITAELTSVWGITFEQSYVNSDIVHVNTGSSTRCELHECAFETAAAGSQAVNVGDGGCLLKDCKLYHGNLSGIFHRAILVTGNSGNNDVVVDNCQITGCLTLDESIIRIEHCKISSRSPTAGIVLTTGGEFHMRHCEHTEVQNDCLQFQAQPNVAVIQDNRLRATNVGYDINATLAVTGFDIAGNLMLRGMHGNISHIDPIKYVAVVGNPKLDFYQTLQHALDACTFDDCVIKLVDDLTLTAEAIPPAYGFRVTIDGNGFHSITRAGASALLALGQNVTLVDLRIYGALRITGTGTLTFVRGYMEGGVDLLNGCTAAAYFRCVRTSIVAQGFMPWAIRMQDVDPSIYVKRSYLKGTAGQPAIYYAVQNDNLKIEHSTIWHGSGAANLPIGRSAAQTPTYCSHHDAYNTDPLAGGWLTNAIAVAQRYNSYDVQSDY